MCPGESLYSFEDTLQPHKPYHCSSPQISWNIRNNKICVVSFHTLNTEFMDFFSVFTLYNAIFRNKSLHIVKHSYCKRPHLPISIKVSEGKESSDWNFSPRKVWLPKIIRWKKVPWLNIPLVAENTIHKLAASFWMIDGRSEVDGSLLLMRSLLPSLGFGGSWLVLDGAVMWEPHQSRPGKVACYLRNHGCTELIVFRRWLGSQRDWCVPNKAGRLSLPQARFSQPWWFAFSGGGDWMLFNSSHLATPRE